ncbi:MAG: exodeoxyribonuclease large subunit [Bacilli bacterium]|nr:exodeoxyribonuclease large subunit [Bacilli bacterium]
MGGRNKSISEVGDEYMALQADPLILTIGELTRYIKARIDTDSNLQGCYIKGELSNFTRHSSGHLYFTLKDDTSRIKAVMFKGAARLLPFLPKDGMKVIARGSVSIFERDGSYQFYADEMQPDGLGSLHLAYEQLKQRLEAEGLFSLVRKRPLPKFPAAIGVITSPTGAAVRDIITTIRRRFPISSVLLYPVLVQGTGAAPSITRAIEEMNRLQEVQVLIVGRGGGSLEELWAFNEETVARAIYASGIPVISAVGHETDFTIADFVADVRAATPTAAAELAVPFLTDLQRGLEASTERLINRAQTMLGQHRKDLDKLGDSRGLTHPHLIVDRRRELIDHHARHLELSLTRQASGAKARVQEWILRLQAQLPTGRVRSLRERLEYLQMRATTASTNRYTLQQSRLDQLILGLNAYNPLGAMRRGYSLVYEANQGGKKANQVRAPRLVRKIQDVNLGDVVSVRLQNGWLECQVWGIKEEKLDGERNAGESDAPRNGIVPSA